MQQTHNFRVIKKNILLLLRFTLLIHTSIRGNVYTITAAAILASLAVPRSIYGRCKGRRDIVHGVTVYDSTGIRMRMFLIVQ